MNLLDFDTRKRILESINSNDNKARRGISFKHQEVYNDRLRQYVTEWLKSQFSEKTVSEMPVISCINVYKRVVDQIGTIYDTPPERVFEGLSDQQVETAEIIYRDSKINSKLKMANKLLVSPKQCAVMVIPKNGKYLVRVLRPHNYNVIPDPENPEEAFAYIISGFNKWNWQDFNINSTATGYSPKSELWEYQDGNTNELVADKEDYKAKLERHVVWSKDYNFIMDGNGDVIDPKTDRPYEGEVDIEEVLSPLIDMQHIPIYDLFAGEKDNEFFIRSGECLYDFCVQFNGTFSDIAQIVRMQGWAQAYMKGPKERLPENLTIGPTRVLYLETDPDNPDVDVEFGFASPSSDVNGSMAFLEKFLFTFISSRGVDPRTISTQGNSVTYNSGLERLLAMIEKMQASKDDYEKLEELEDWIFKTILAWNAVAPDAVETKYQLGSTPEDSEVSVKFAGPQKVNSQKEELENLDHEIKLGLISRVEAVMERRNVNRDEAVKILQQIEEDKGIVQVDRELVVADSEE